MIEITYEEMNLIAGLYEKSTDSTITSAITGYMGRAFVDDKDDPRAALILQGDFLFPASDGALDVHTANQMMEEIYSYCNGEHLLIVPQSKEWYDYIDTNQKFRKYSRYALKQKEIEEFDTEKLKGYVSQLNPKYNMCRIDEKLYEKAISEAWSRDFCSNYKSAKDFVTLGLGMVIMDGDKLICGASSYTSYPNGIEIELVTNPDYRKQGLATCVSAGIILECIKEHKKPHWDAANMISVGIAEKMGYEYIGPYDTFILKNS